MTDFEILNWLNEDISRLHDAYLQVHNHGGTLREAVEYLERRNRSNFGLDKP